MTNHRANKKRPGLFEVIILGLVILSLVTGCGTTTLTEPQVVAVDTALSTAVTTTPMPPDVATRQAIATMDAERRNEVRTRVALTPTWPPRTPGPEMTPTASLGLHDCVPANTYEPQVYNCWLGVVDGQYVTVAAGMEGYGGDLYQGVVMIFHNRYYSYSDPTTEIYRTPQKVGPVRIVSINGLQFTVESFNVQWGVWSTPLPSPTLFPQVTFVFDLPSRQWVTGTPGPSLTTEPLRSPSPLATGTP